MCTAILLRRPDHHWPLLLAANRDEMDTRPWRPPGRHWPDRPEVIAGLDELIGGSWIGLNDYGVAAMMLNRTGTLGPSLDKRSRGELVLEALDNADATGAAAAFRDLNPGAYRPFNLIVADNRDAYWVANHGPAAGITVHPLPEGYAMIDDRNLNDAASPRVAMYLPRFRTAAVPDPDTGDWAAWEALLASRDHDPTAGPRGALCVVTETGFGTVSSSLIALPAPGRRDARPIWRFAAGRPGEEPFQAVDIGI